VWQSVIVAGVVGTAIAVAGIGFLVLGAPGFPTLLQGPLWLYLLPFVSLPAAMLIEYWLAILRGMNRIVLHNAVDIGRRLITFAVLVILLVGFRLDVAGAVLANIAVTLVSALFLVGVLWYIGVLSRPVFDRVIWRRTLKFALPAYGGNVASYLNYRVDEFFIAIMLSAEQLAFYVVAVGLVERVWLLPGSVSAVLLPHLTNSKERNPLISAAIARHMLILVGGGCLCLFLFADTVVELLYSSTFAAVATPLRWLLPGILALSVARVVLPEVIAREKPLYPSIASGVACVVNIVGNLLLIPVMGISGSALASTISYCLVSLMWILYYLRITRVSWTSLIPSAKDLEVYRKLWQWIRSRWWQPDLAKG
jgi:O-antigen/teichoic acid export membrane protein